MYIILKKTCQHPAKTVQKAKISVACQGDAKFLIILLKVLLSKTEKPGKCPPRPHLPSGAGQARPGRAAEIFSKNFISLFSKKFSPQRENAARTAKCPGRRGSYCYIVSRAHPRRSGHRPVLRRGISRGVYSIRVMLTGASAPPSLSRARIFPISRSTESRAFWRV